MPVQNVYLFPLATTTRRLYAGLLAPVYEQRWRALLNRVKQIPEGDSIARLGAGMVRGTVTVQGVPGQHKVVACSASDLRLRGATRSDPVTGKFTVYPLVNTQRQTIIGQDARIRFNSVIADGVLPVPWEDE